MTQISDLNNMVCDAVNAVEFKLVRDASDIENDHTTFRPAMAHQIFGENENIFGYTDLKIRLYFTAGPLQIYLGMKYSQKVDDFNQDGIKADDVISKVDEVMPSGGSYFTNIDEFLMTLEKAEQFNPFGEKIESFNLNEGNTTRTFEIYKCNHADPKFQSYFQRLQSFVLWFVDAANYIDIDDPQWMIFVCYEKYIKSDGKTMYASVGYSTVYNYYAYPNGTRPRISQMLILPPFQKLGVGTKLMRTLIQSFIADQTVTDITVEDPSEEFQRIRNYVDASYCMKLPSFSEERLKMGFTQDMVKEAKAAAKINSKQCRTVYEILRLFHTNELNEIDCRDTRLDIKKRLNASFAKQRNDLKKITARGVDTTAALAMLPTIEERIEQLKEEYQGVVDGYQNVIERLQEAFQ